MDKLSTLLLVLLVAAVVAQGEPTYEDAKKLLGQEFRDLNEDAYRRNVYNANVAKARANNADPKSTHKEGITPFIFMTQGEFVSTVLRTKRPDGTQLTVSTPIVGAWTVTTGKDWTKVLNVVTKVKNQGQCGSCWAFSAVAALESLRFQAYKVIADFSEQQLVDCSGSYGNGGCNGGWMNNAFNYTKVMGITNESLYAYTATDGTCKPLTGTLFKISKYATVSANCDAVAAAVILRPLSVAVDASNWGLYINGVFRNCATAINHGVLLVGVKKTEWMIKNSWGTGWGELGFIRLSATGGNSTCAVCGYASYPIK